jgi:hypothetical protein
MYAVFRDDDPKWCRLRIIEPEGVARWFNQHGTDMGESCWANGIARATILGYELNPDHQVQLMRIYDQDIGYSPAVYIGEIK